MPLDAASNVVPFPTHRIARGDRALIEQWRANAAPLGVAGVKVRNDRSEGSPRHIAERIAIQFRRGIADGHFVVIQRARGERSWTSLLLRVEADGSMTLPIENEEVVRQDGSLRDALNAVCPVLPDQDCSLVEYSAARREG